MTLVSAEILFQTVRQYYLMLLHAIGYGRLRRKFVTWDNAISDYSYNNLQQIHMLRITTQYIYLPTFVPFFGCLFNYSECNRKTTRLQLHSRNTQTD